MEFSNGVHNIDERGRVTEQRPPLVGVSREQPTGGYIPHYFERDPKGDQHDGIVRCRECKRLARHQDVCTHGGCPRCGHREVTMARTLTLWEWLRIRLGILDFPKRNEFLKEFSRGRR